MENPIIKSDSDAPESYPMTESTMLVRPAYDYGHDRYDRNDRYNEAGMIAAGGICDLREEVKDAASNIRADVKDAECNLQHGLGDVKMLVKESEAEIRSDVKGAECQIIRKVGDAECALSKEILESKHVLGKDILRAEYEAKLTAQTVIKEVSEKVDRESERTNDKIIESRNFNAEKFCAIENLIKENRTKYLEDKVFRQSQDLQTAQLLKAICCGCGDTLPTGK